MYCLALQGTEHRPGDDSDTDTQDETENEFVDYAEIANNSEMLAKLSKGWTAYIIAVLPASNL